MLRNLFFISVLLLLALAAGEVAENPGQMTMDWFGYRLETSAAFLLISLFATAFFIWLALKLLEMLVTMPQRFGKARHSLQQEKGLQALTEAFIALGDQELTAATKYIQQAEKFLPDPTLPRLLNLQLARQQGDEAAVQTQFRALGDSAQTRPLALRGLIEEARRNQQMTEALTYAEELLKLRPKHMPTMILVADIFSYHRRWQEALQLIAAGQKRLILSRSEARRISALIYLEQAQKMLAEQNRSSALELLKAALKKDAGFPAAACLIAEIYLQMEKLGSAAADLRKAWAAQPHPALAEIYEKTYSGLPPQKRLKKIQELVKPNPQALESLIALSRAAIAAQDWALARQSLKAAMAQQETVSLCKLMAELEQQEMKDTAKANHWLERAITAVPDSLWRCNSCGDQPATWSAHCTECTHFDSIHWQPPHYAVYRLPK